MFQRMLWMSIGFAATGCGIAGIILPLVPTTPFLLLAAFAFARSSPLLHRWLVTHPRLGPPIRDWHKHRAVGRPGKIAAIAFMFAAIALSAAMGVRGWIVLTQAVVMVAVAAFLLTRPEPPAGDA